MSAAMACNLSALVQPWCGHAKVLNFSLVRNAELPWRRGLAQSAPAGYKAIVIGGGGHGLMTAYLAEEHGITDVAVLEKVE